ncbi:6191_t:CDS:2 [Acaulospora morrowiae]|uniref:6191_t:CDS:1 n=1 Tax=Acaulospora morrowiae TaxID=94023 RepID=A0A9N8V605_9GLOM|nr:6191_t:CDS:2 [Acaulospora morrowiae]
MVKLEEVSEEHEFTDEEEDNESISSADSGSSEEYQESFIERILALRDIIPEDTRESISNNVSTIVHIGAKSARFLGNAFWVLTTSALILVMPLALEIEREHTIIQMENEQKALMGGQPGVPYDQSGSLGQHSQSQQQPRLVPPGF